MSIIDSPHKHVIRRRRQRTERRPNLTFAVVSYEWVETPVPDWCVVQFPGNRIHCYPNLERANNARIWARAFFNLRGLGPLVVGVRGPEWSALAKHIGLVKPPPYKGISSHSGSFVYNHVRSGRLPEDETIKAKLFKLAGYPWQ